MLHAMRKRLRRTLIMTSSYSVGTDNGSPKEQSIGDDGETDKDSESELEHSMEILDEIDSGWE